jgi:hypothetical protein
VYTQLKVALAAPNVRGLASAVFAVRSNWESCSGSYSMPSGRVSPAPCRPASIAANWVSNWPL